MKNIEVWKPISIDTNWLGCETSRFDDLAPSWYKKRKDFEDGKNGYEEFLTKLKRQHAIETGIVEKLYDLNEGITETLIKEGFVESYISHNDTNIPPKKLMSYLHDHFEAMDFIFDLVKSERELTKSFIKELHQLITRHQDYTEAINGLGERVSIKLLKGEFKTSDNNPRRENGVVFLYCPPVHVDSEMDSLISIYNEYSKKNLNPIILAAWFHHAFTQIHPFQDGNGRIARLLASLILIKNGLLPFTVKRTEKAKYIGALETADNEEPQDLVSFFSLEQKKSIENALNFKTERKLDSLSDLAILFNDKVSDLASKKKIRRERDLKKNRDKVFDIIYNILGDIKEELFELIPYDKAKIGIASSKPDHNNYYYHTHQITEYANTHNYYFNRNLPRGWFGIHFTLADNKKFNLIMTVHHYGYEDDVLAIGSFLEYTVSLGDDVDEEDKNLIPINLEPFTISLDGISERASSNLDAYLHDILKIGLTIIINEIN
ncbi:MAG: cell filamentation protein Fic [Flavobacteriaceae bacterium]|nr:MAG: cell filamentation protein Fic [Flavobacteriaceae bacterium]